jgi:DNA repair protein SbcC/Rad50
MKDFQNINRVDEKPEGYIIIEDDKGKEIKLSRKKDLTKTVGLTTSECRNILIIRNTDLSIAPESEFYTNLTDQLTGLRTKEIFSIKKKLREPVCSLLMLGEEVISIRLCQFTSLWVRSHVG